MIYKVPAEVFNNTWQESIRLLMKDKMEFINTHKEEIVAAFIAKTGCQPDECELVIQETAPDCIVVSVRKRTS